LPLALPFTHTLTGAGAIAGVGTIGTTKALPATLFAQYRFGDAKAAFRPYLGAGLTYAYFYDENATNTLNALSRRHAVQSHHVLDRIQIRPERAGWAPPTPSTSAGSLTASWATPG
jgi:outer membrane protein W